jgi:serine/threonine protein kinase/TolB-like protein/Tfp pilus assembly protein PilF
MSPDRWNKIDELLDVAMELPLERRASYLAEACAGDEELRHEVESLLLAHEKSGTFIETTPAKGMAAAFVKSFQFSPQEMIGRTLGHYRIEALLGAGGMGEVYRARDARLDRNVAIKVLPRHLSSHPDALARFEREAKAIAALPHPNILAIHDFGREGGVTYAVTELLEGETLRQRIRPVATAGLAGVGWREAVKIAASVAEGLVAAHARGIIHRDIKPENIFLTAEGVVKVLDFGIARVKKAVVSNAQTLISQGASETKPGTLMGTIGYMSPEQVRGDNADAPSDIFSLGCVLVEMLIGERPFARDSAAETMAAILRDEPPSLDCDHLEIPPELEKIIHRCLAKMPEERFQSARDLALDLRSLLTGTSGAYRAASGAFRQASGSMPAPQLSKETSYLGRGWLVAAMIALLAITAITAVWTAFRPAKPSANSIAVLPFANASGDPETNYLSEGIPESITYSLASLPQLRVMGWSTVRYKAQAQKEADPQKIGRELNVYAVVLGKIAQQDDRLLVTVEMINVEDGRQLWGSRYDVTMADARNVQSEIARKISDSLPVKLTGEQQQQLSARYNTNAEAYQSYLQGRYYLNQRTSIDWEEGLKKAIDYFTQAKERDPYFALAYAGLADAYVLLEDNSKNAIAAANKALSLAPKLVEPRATIAFAQFQYDWLWQESEKGFLQAIEMNPRYATAHHWYAEFLTTQGRFNEAIKEIKLASEIEPLSLPITVDWGIYLFFARRHDEAIAQLRKTLEFDPENLKALSFLTATYEQKRAYPQSVAIYLDLARKQNIPAEDIEAIQSAFAQNGITGYWRQKLSMALQSRSTAAPIRAAYLHAALNEKDQAFRLLESAYQKRHFGLCYLKVDPRYDNLRNDPRFPELLRRMNLLN